jgi:RNA polymerase sigma factor (sigma-70 family)
VTPANYRDLGDPELIALCLNGEGAAWEALIHRYRRLIYSTPVRFGFSNADASDVFQSVCLALIEHLHELKDESRLGGWIVTTAMRQCLRMRKLNQRESTAEREVLPEENPDPEGDAEEMRIRGQMQSTIHEAVERLPERCRLLIEMLFFDVRERTYEEIGRALQMPVASIGPTRARCLSKLQSLLRVRGIR